MHKKSIAVLGALVAFGALTASAASLGGLTSASLGADQTVVASCDTDGIALAYGNTYNATTNTYQTTTVTMSGVNAACATKTFKLTLSNGTISLGEATGAVTLTSGSQTVTLGTAIDSTTITKASLVITG
jgi:hypothetical protein